MKIWKPFPKQEIALSYTHKDAFEILFGGARGPGKTDTGMVWLLGEEYEKDKLYIDHPRYRALVLRKNYEDLTDWLDRASHMYRRYGAVVVGKPAQIRFPSGALFKCGHLRDAKSYEKYLGHEYQRELTEELTQIAEEKFFVQILGSCRSTIPELRPQVFSTTNPGGPGHAWVRGRYIDPSEPMKPFSKVKNDDGDWVKIRPRVFIPATLDDNPILLKNDPGYVEYLESIKETDSELYRAWRHGDWDVFAGQVFREFNRNHHVITPVVPEEGTFYLWMDWGYSDHHETSFSAYLSTVVNSTTPDGQNYHQVITFQEWCGNRKDPEEWARIIYKSCKAMGIRPKTGIVDPSMLDTKKGGGKLPGNLMMDEWKRLNGKKWCSLAKGDNSRGSRIGGVGVVHKWLSSPNKHPKTLPYWQITETCKHLIRTLPMLVYDENRVEDVDTTMEDHPYDAVRYGLTKVKFVSVKPGAYSAVQEKKKVNLPTDERGLPVVDPKSFFGSLS